MTRLLVVDAQLLAPSGIELRGIDNRHAGDVRIGFGGDVEAASTGSRDERDAFERIGQAGAVDVNDVEWRTGDCGCSDHFLDRFNIGAGLQASETADVGVDGYLSLGGNSEHVDYFEARGAGCVLNAHANAEGAGVEFVTQTLLDLLYLVRGGGIVGPRPALGQNFRDAGVRVENIGRQRCAED